MSTIPDQYDLLESLPEGHIAKTYQGRYEMLQGSRAAAKMAYAPDSNFYVGSYLKAWDGTEHAGTGPKRKSQRFGGNNTETGNYEGLNCGERGAIIDAVTHGAALNNREFIEAIAVSCVKAPSPYKNLIDQNPGFAKNLMRALEAQTGDVQHNFAAMAPGWLKDRFALAGLANGSPCGACRQVIREFSGPDTVVILDDLKDGVLFRMKDLLPIGFCFGAEADDNKPPVQVKDVAALEKQAQSDPSRGNLIKVARAIAENSYSWGFGSFKRNGTVLITNDGKAIVGASMINSSTGLSINSPRAAITRAVAKGAAQNNDGQFIAKAVTAFIDPPENGRGELERGVYADLLQEFAHAATEITLANTREQSDFTQAELFSAIRNNQVPSVHW